MIVQQILGAALLVTAGFDPIDRAHGAKPTRAATKEAKQDEPGLWTRVKGRFFSQKSEVKPAQSTSRTGSQVSSARTRADSEDREQTVYSNVTVRQLLGNRINPTRDSKKPENKTSEATPSDQENKRPILDRLRSRLTRNRQKPAAEPSAGRFVWFKKSSVQAKEDSDPQEVLELTEVAVSPASDPTTPAFADLILPNPARESDLLTRSDSNPDSTVSPALVTAADADAETRETEGTPTPLQSDASSELQPQLAGPSLAAKTAVLDFKSGTSGSAEFQDVEQAGPTLVDPSTAISDRKLVRIPISDEHTQASPASPSGAESVLVAGQPDAAAVPAPSEQVEPAMLDMRDRKMPTTIAQTGFVRNATPVAAKGSSNTQQDARASALNGTSASNKSVLSAFLSPALCERLTALPVECYPIGGLFLGSMLVLLLSRGRRTASDAAAPHPGHVATHLPGAFGGPIAMIFPATSHVRGTEQSAQARGGLFGAFTTSVGLAIIAVGATAVLISQVAQQPGLTRPGVMIAATGQFVLLLGIIALTVHRRSANARNGAGSGLAHTAAVVAGTSPFLPLGAGYAWPTAIPASGVQSNQSGQIAQLKAQLACLSQQLDHLGGAETESKNKAA